MIRSWHFNVCNYFHILGEILTVFSLFQCIWSHHRLQKLTGVTVSYINYYQIKLLITKKLMDYQLPNLSQRNSSMLVSWNTVMSLLEAPCAKTSWRALLFRTILGITGALIVCFDIWWFKQVNNSETGFSGHHCDFGQHVSCLAVHVCMNSVKFVLKAPGASILWGRYYSVTMCRLIRWALLLGRALLIGTLRYMHNTDGSVQDCNNSSAKHWSYCSLELSHQYDLCDIVVIVRSAWWCWWPGTSLVPVHLLPGLWCVLVNAYQGSSAEI